MTDTARYEKPISFTMFHNVAFHRNIIKTSQFCNFSKLIKQILKLIAYMCLHGTHAAVVHPHNLYFKCVTKLHPFPVWKLESMDFHSSKLYVNRPRET